MFKDFKANLDKLAHGLQEIFFIIVITLVLFLFLALASYNSQDPGWSHSGTVVTNITGALGAYLADIMLSFFGYLGYFIPVLTAAVCAILFKKMRLSFCFALFTIKLFGGLLLLITACTLLELYIPSYINIVPQTSGGIVGKTINQGLLHTLGMVGETLILVAGFMSSLSLVTKVSWREVLMYLYTKFKKLKTYKLPKPKPKPKIIKTKVEPKVQPKLTPVVIKTIATEEYSLPQVDLLDTSESKNLKPNQARLNSLASNLERVLSEFGIKVTVTAIIPGPVVTRFELSLSAGLKVSKISTLVKDIARSLSVCSVRVVEVIPGKPVVGLEIPNEERITVRLKDILASEQYLAAQSALTLSLGQDIEGKPIITDLVKMPHLLVAGTTGSGKSVGVNAMLISILYKSSPADVRLILIDPKMLELAVYANIPHLLTPVVTDMKDAGYALQWCVQEMERRYKIMASVGVKSLDTYNAKIKSLTTPIKDPLWVPKEGEEAPDLEPMPRIVIVIDEFADLIMVTGKKVEELIARIAQKARAAGMHMMLATQRPSVDVITGLIKANIPTRICFQVSSKIDSRTVLDQSGAEQLLGNGDMLFLPPGAGIPVRVHGAFVSEQEVHDIVDYIKSKNPSPDYIEDLITETAVVANTGDQDELFDKAVYLVTTTKKTSASNLQRRFKIGYNRAARLIEELEAHGIISPVLPSGGREVLVSSPEE